jgi:two-component system sensor histidine kinase/response regulator
MLSLVKHYTAILVLLVAPTLLFAQAYQIDSLKNVLGKTTDNSLKFDIYIQLADAIIHNDPAKSLEYSRQALANSYSEFSKQNEAKAYNRIGAAYWSFGEVSSAFENEKIAYEIAKEIGDKELEARCLSIMANIFYTLGDYAQAIVYDREALEYFFEIQNQNRLIAMYNNIGLSFTKLNQYDSAEYFLSKAYNLSTGENEFLKPNIMINLGEISLRQKHYNETDKYFKGGLELAIKFDDLRAQSEIYLNLARIEMIHNNDSLALFYSKNAVLIVESIQNKELIYISYAIYAKALGASGRYKEAHHYDQQAIAYRDSVQSEKATTQLNFYNYNREQGEIALLKKDKEYAALIEKQNANYIKILTAVVILLMISFIFLMINRKDKVIANKKLGKINTEIQKQKSAIDSQRRKLESINKSKDRIFSIVTHDFRSPLNSLKSLIAMIEDEFITLEEFKMLLPEVSKKLNSTSILLENILLWAQVQINNDYFQAKTIDLKAQVDEQIQLSQSEIDIKKVDIINNVLQNTKVFIDPNIIGIVVRNILGNAIKYSFSSGKIELSAEEDEAFCKFIIRDFGIGMDETQLEKLFVSLGKSKEGTEGEKGSGFGLQLSKDFIEDSGGSLEVKSELGEGTTFTVFIPKEEEINKNTPLSIY